MEHKFVFQNRGDLPKNPEKHKCEVEHLRISRKCAKYVQIKRSAYSHIYAINVEGNIEKNA